MRDAVEKAMLLAMVVLPCCCTADAAGFSDELARTARALAQEREVTKIDSEIDRLARSFPVETDWLNQAMSRPQLDDQGRSKALRAYLQAADHNFIRSAVVSVADDLGANGGIYRNRTNRLTAEGIPRHDPRWLDLYVEACETRRAERLRRVRAEAPRILFIKRHTVRASFYGYTEGASDAYTERHFLPAGDLIFSSTRCVQAVDCWQTEVSNLYTCDKDGRYLRRLGFDQVHTTYPNVLNDGRVVYTRWDYNDRGQVYPQPLFQMNPDGTGQTEYYGNNSWFPTTTHHARAIPGSSKIVTVLHGHHSWQAGKLALIDRSKGTQEAAGVQLIAPVRDPKVILGEATSGIVTALRKGHGETKLSREELDKFCAWIDLAVPLCGDYLERNTWSNADFDRYIRYQRKRELLATKVRRNTEALYEKQTGRPLILEDPEPRYLREVAAKTREQFRSCEETSLVTRRGTLVTTGLAGGTVNGIWQKDV